MPYELPAEINPPQVDVCVPVPNDRQHIRAFLAQLEELGKYWAWDKDPTKSLAKQAAAVWASIHLVVAHRFDEADFGCGDDGCDGDDVGEILDGIQVIKNQITTLDGRVREMKAEVRRLLYTGTPTSVNPQAPGTTFDSTQPVASDQEADWRAAALCQGVRKFVYDTLYQYYLATLALYGGAAASAAALAFLFGGPLAGMIAGGTAAAIAGVLTAAVVAAVEDQETIDEVVCDLVKAMRGRAISQANFAAAVDSLDAGTGNRAVIVGALKQFRNQIENYLFMIDALGAGYTAAQAGAENDCCEDEITCEGWIDFQSDGIAFGSLWAGSLTAGQGVHFTYHNDPANVRSMNWRYGWEDPCSFDNSDFRVKLAQAVNNQVTVQVTVRRADTGAWVALGGPFTQNASPEWSITRETTTLVSEITGIGVQANVAEAVSPTASVIRGMWWGPDTTGTPPF